VRYHDRVFERFWRRELDIENPEVLEAVLREAGANKRVSATISQARGAASTTPCRRPRTRRVSSACRVSSSTASFFWGSEHLPDIREMLRM
jgi:hypothetical protein